MKYRVALIILFCCSLLIACGSDLKTDIVGGWRGLDGHQDLVFYGNGKVVMQSPRHSDYEGEYTIKDGNRMTFVFYQLSRPIECEAKISNNELTLVHPGGRKEVYARK